mgnify:CR=1 FL=1
MNFIYETDWETAELEAEARVPLTLPGAGGCPWEGGLNGRFYRIPRGIEVEVPASVAAIIEENGEAASLARESIRAYAVGRGKRLA